MGEALVDCVIEDDRWEGFGLDALARRGVEAVLAHLGLPQAGMEVVVMGCDDARIAALNADFRGKPVPTNVLSWPSEERGAEEPGGLPRLPENPEELGDMALAWETCMAEAAEQGKAPADHVLHLVIHSCLHLLGFDHVDEADAARMEGAEVAILATLGVADPY